MQKLEALIAKGREASFDVLEKINETQPEDRLAHAQAVGFEPQDRALRLIAGDYSGLLHSNALRQAAAKCSVPWTYVSRLTSHETAGWGPDLLAENLNRIMSSQFAGDETRFLLRSVGGEVRGFLSDRYRRLDSRPLVDAFAASCSDLGAVPVDGFVSQTRVGVRAILPTVLEPVPNEVMAVGVSFENSDFGNGALSVRAFVLRLWCTNYAIADESIRAVHLGSRLDRDISWSERTRRLDTESMASAVSDVVQDQLSAAAVERLELAVKSANERNVSASQVAGFLRKHTTRAQAKEVADAFNGADVEMLPPGQTAWRLSNALSWVAGRKEDPEQKAEFQKLAGRALKIANAKA